jgi:hypothetical protein
LLLPARHTPGGNFMWLRHARSACSLWLSSADQDAFEGWHDGHMRLGAGGVSLKLVVPRVENAIHQVQRASVVPIAGWIPAHSTGASPPAPYGGPGCRGFPGCAARRFS